MVPSMHSKHQGIQESHTHINPIINMTHTGASKRIMAVRLSHIGLVPRTYPSPMAVPKPFPGAGDITLSSGWMSSSTTMVVRGLDGSVTYNGEAAVSPLTCPLKSSKACRCVRSHKVIATPFLQGIQCFSLTSHGTDGCFELSELVLILLVAHDIGDEPPVAEVNGGVP